MPDGKRGALHATDTGAPRSPSAASMPLVFLHGAGWSGVAWQRQIDALWGAHRCIAIDLPGHGASRDTAWTSLDDAADAVAEAIETTVSSPAHVIGFSLGADVGIRLLARHPETVASALLTGVSTQPVALLERILDSWTSPLVSLPVVHRLLTRSMRLSSDVRASYLASSAPMRMRDYSRMSREVLRGTSLAGVSRAHAPVLALAGSCESRHARESAGRLARAMPVCVAASVPRASHTWVVRNPALFTAVVRAWIREPGALHPALTPLPKRHLRGA